MVAVVPGYRISTPYGKPGGWSGGKHGGVDYAAPTGATVVAPWSGRITGLSWGNAYGIQVVIDFDKLPDGSPGLWGVIAHMSRKVVSAGQRVRAGQKIGEVGSTGNSTGPHAHFEVQRQANWVGGSHVNPQPWLDAGAGTAPPPATKWAFPSGSKVYRSKVGFDAHETNPDRESDSIKMLQEMLNAHTMPGGHNLPITGKYWIGTDQEVRLCQRLHLPPADPERQSFVGPKQFAHLKTATGAPYVWHDDGPYVPPSGKPEPPPDPGPPEWDGQWHVPASLRALRAEVDQRWPDRDKSSDGTIGDPAHSVSKSEHNPVGHPFGPAYGTAGAVHAMDITARGIEVDEVLAGLIGDQRVWYVIYDRKIWSKNYGPWDERFYTGSNPHTTHIHVSLAADNQAMGLRNELDASAWLDDDGPPPDPEGKYATKEDVERLERQFDLWRRAVADSMIEGPPPE